MIAKFVKDSLNEASHVKRAWNNKLENINNVLSHLYDKMSQSDKNLKDKIFMAYYRFYNDGDLYRLPYETLKKLGMSEEGEFNLKYPYSYTAKRRNDAMYGKDRKWNFDNVYGRYMKGLEEAAEVVMKYLLKKYKSSLNKKEFILKSKKEIYNNIINDNFEKYWIKDYGKNFNIPELLAIVKELEENKDLVLTSEMKSKIHNIILNDIDKTEANF